MPEPTTEAGKRLLAMLNREPPVGMVPPEAVLAIEAEAIAADRARLRAAVLRLASYDGPRRPSKARGSLPGPYVSRAAILRLLDGPET